MEMAPPVPLEATLPPEMCTRPPTPDTPVDEPPLMDVRPPRTDAVVVEPAATITLPVLLAPAPALMTTEPPADALVVEPNAAIDTEPPVPVVTSTTDPPAIMTYPPMALFPTPADE